MNKDAGNTSSAIPSYPPNYLLLLSKRHTFDTQNHKVLENDKTLGQSLRGNKYKFRSKMYKQFNHK